MKGITILDFASICDASYNKLGFGSVVKGFARHGFISGAAGFQGATYKRANGKGLDIVIAYAGTQPTKNMGEDLLADFGFGGLGPG